MFGRQYDEIKVKLVCIQLSLLVQCLLEDDIAGVVDDGQSQWTGEAVAEVRGVLLLSAGELPQPGQQ